MKSLTFSSTQIHKQNQGQDNSDGDAGSGTQSLAKRAACERCRRQKLRCVRDDAGKDSDLEFGKCNRCKAINADCHYGVAQRAGRRKTTHRTAISGEIATGSSNCCASVGAPSQARGLSQNQAETFDSPDATSASDIWRDGNPLDDFFDNNDLASSFSALPNEHFISSLDHADHNANSFSNDALALTSLSGNAATALSQNETETDSLCQMLDLSSYDSSMERMDWSCLFGKQSLQPQPFGATQSEDCSSAEQVLPQDYEMLDVALSQEPLDLDSALQSSGKVDFARAPSVKRHLKIDTSAAAIAVDKAPPSDEFHQNTWRLSQLEVILHSVLASCASSENKPEPLSSGMYLDDSSIADVLKCSTAFMDILASFFRPTGSQIPSMSSPQLSDGLCTPSSLSDWTTLSENLPQWQKDLSTSTRKTLDNSEPSRSADMPTAFKLLMCYLQITHLHSILYARIYRTLSEQVQNDGKNSQLPPIFPGMQVGGVPLDDYGNFQVKYLLQILTHLLGEIEARLGLPTNLRISKESVQRRGILEASVSPQFVEMAVMEHRRKGATDGSNGYVNIKDSLRKIREILKTAIEV